PRRPDGEAAALAIKYVGEHIPCADHAYSSSETGTAIEPFKDVCVWIRFFVVAIDALVWCAGDDFVVPRIGKLSTVCHGHDAPFPLVSDELAVPGNRIPKEWKENFASLLGCVAPEIRPQHIRVLHA